MVIAFPIIAKAEITQRQTRSHSLSPVLVLLAFSVFINYVDRGDMSIAAPMLKDELGLSASQLGILLSSFSGPTDSFRFSRAGSSIG